MIALLQRVTRADVSVGSARIAEIGRGLAVMIAVERGDTSAEVDRMADRLLRFRAFADQGGRMNMSVCDVGGDLLLIPQFTLAADTNAGHRPSFTRAADPQQAAGLFDALVARAARSPLKVASGAFGATMQVTLTNDGPVTFWVRVAPRPGVEPGFGA